MKKDTDKFVSINRRDLIIIHRMLAEKGEAPRVEFAILLPCSPVVTVIPPCQASIKGIGNNAAIKVTEEIGLY